MKLVKRTLAIFLCLLFLATGPIGAFLQLNSHAETTEVDSESVNQISAVTGDCEVTVSGQVSEDMTLSLNDVDIDTDEFGIENEEDVVTSLDIKVMDGETEWQPEEGDQVTITFDAAALGMQNGDEFVIYHQHEGVVSVSDVYIVENDQLTFQSNGFSIYVVVGTYSNDWNYNNYQITMTTGDSRQVTSTSNGRAYKWTLVDGDVDSFRLTNTNNKTATLRAVAPGEATLQCEITTNNGRTTEETMKVVALASVGDSVNDDIIFANIDKAYRKGDTEYENTYGPYVMKIRFEDDDGNVLKYADGTTVGEDYYVFDSETNIDVNTFAASAPDGYTYAGAFFYWSGHFSGDKVYVTSVDRDNSKVSAGSYLWYSGTHSTSGAGRWYYQASGVLHIVYVPIDEVHTVIFKDHCGYELANYALQHNDSGVKFPAGYVDNIDNMEDTLIPNHHTAHDAGYEFSGNWIVTGGGRGIDGTYTTAELKSAITKWNITSNITITAECAEPDVTIQYEVVGPEGCGTVTPTAETVKVTGTANGSTAAVNDNYRFVGWYSDAECTTQISTELQYVPSKNADGKHVAATYYAKFEAANADLTITKSGADDVDENQIFLFTITGPNDLSMQVVINGNRSVTIKNLPIGEYTITENQDWAWRYSLTGITAAKDAEATVTGSAITVDLTAEGETVSFTNTRSQGYWLGGDSFVENVFSAAAAAAQVAE